MDKPEANDEPSEMLQAAIASATSVYDMASDLGDLAPAEARRVQIAALDLIATLRGAMKAGKAG